MGLFAITNLCAWWQQGSEPNTNPGILAEGFSNCPGKLHEHVHDLNSTTETKERNEMLESSMFNLHFKKMTAQKIESTPWW
jgi:hypothetical protein